jgi:hypothetical protein
MTEPSAHVELRHACAICGNPAALPAEGGMQLSVINAKRRVVGWAVHSACLQGVLAPSTRNAFDHAFEP